jgi:asparagine N-glycosylation enzyme membrane subunit Stt3
MDKITRIENKENSLINKEKSLENKELSMLEKERMKIVDKENQLINEQKKLETKENHIIEKENRIISGDMDNRGENIMNFFKSNPKVIFYVILVLLVILGVYIRMQPLMDHNGKPGLWDITTNDYTLGPDLDPFLFLRYAKEMITTGSIPADDTMRYVPLGYDTTKELQMVSYMIVLTYKALNMFGTYSANYAGAFMPVWMFALTIIAFFLFVRQIFLRKIEDSEESARNYIQANIIALISTLFMIVMPGFLYRTVAGIPEKESVAFFFMFMAFYLFIRAWRTEKFYASLIIGILSGVSTGLMGLSWGGVTYIYITIGLAGLVALVLNKIGKKEGLVYLLWLVSALAITLSFTSRFSITDFITSIDTSLATLTFGAIIIHAILWKTKIHEKIKLDGIKLPKTIISLIITILLAIIAISLLFGPGFFLEKLKILNQTLIKPVTGRWNTTVA